MTSPNTEGGQTVLLVEDDQGLRESLATVLSYQGLHIVQAGSAEDGWQLVRDHDPAIIILDVNLPGKDGFEFLHDLRAGGDSRQVLLLTARHEVADRVKGLDAGADDYLPKPFALDELLARVRTLLRRAESSVGVVENQERSTADRSATRTVGSVLVEGLARRVLVSGSEVELTKLEYDLLTLLFDHDDQVLTRSIIHDRIWGYDEDYGSNTLEVLISSLRRKLEVNGAARVLHTVRGVGYVARSDRNSTTS